MSAIVESVTNRATTELWLLRTLDDGSRPTRPRTSFQETNKSRNPKHLCDRFRFIDFLVWVDAVVGVGVVGVVDDVDGGVYSNGPGSVRRTMFIQTTPCSRVCLDFVAKIGFEHILWRQQFFSGIV